MVESRQSLTVALRGGVATLAVGGLAYAVWSNRAGAAALEWGGAGAAFGAAAVLFAVAPLVQASCFVLALREVGAQAPWMRTLVVWMRSFVLRYAPTGAVGYVYRVRRRRRLGAETDAVWRASAYEQLVALAAGGVVAVAAFAADGEAAPWPVVGASAVVLAVLAFLRPRFTLLVAANALGWIPTAAAVWLLVRALAPDADVSVGWLAGAYACAWLAGFVVPLVPGGLGLREGVFAAFLAGPIGGGAALTVALALRLANLIGEVLAFATVEAAGAASRGPSAGTRGQPPPAPR